MHVYQNYPTCSLVLNSDLTKMNFDPIKDLMDVVNFAAEKHKDQRRKNAQATPYINHPIGM